MREKFERGGTEVGVARAYQLADRRDLDAADEVHAQFFARRSVDKDAKTHAWGSNTDPSAGFIAWLLWGVDAGKAWADRKAKSIE